MTVDQSILAPVFLILFHGAVGIVQRRTMKQISDKIYEEFYPNMVIKLQDLAFGAVLELLPVPSAFTSFDE